MSLLRHVLLVRIRVTCIIPFGNYCKASDDIESHAAETIFDEFNEQVDQQVEVKSTYVEQDDVISIQHNSHDR